MSENNLSFNPDALNRKLAERLSALMTANEVLPRQQAGLLAELCGLSGSQARRKLHGASWSFDEVLALVRKFGASMDELCAELPIGGTAPGVRGVDVTQLPMIDAMFWLDSGSIPCQVRLGARYQELPDDDGLFAVFGKDDWQVGNGKILAKLKFPGPFFRADQVLLLPESNEPGIRIAILDDDVGTTETLCDWFAAAGYAATAFNNGQDLLVSGIDSYDAFVIDFMLGGGDTSHAVIATIRKTRPEAPILLLTGKLKEGLVSESDLTTLLRTANAIFFEKPVRPSVLAASIESALDKAAEGKVDD